ncbi:MAG: ParB/RepB/Spo0J family partition protein [Spirochaetales bacterium]|nr:ParB/RepB/Spo0J family partition protein [Spirochaetales bacterium]
MSKKALGKGIEALLQSTQNKELEKTLGEIDIGLIKPNPNQPRKLFSDQSLQELAASIKEKGVLQPILVEKANDNTFLIIAGERRFRAAKIAGLSKIPIIMKDFSETEKLEISLIENIQREDLTPIEEAEAYKNLLELTQVSQEELASHLGKNRSTIANSIRLLKLPRTMQDSLQKGDITAGHARAILAIDEAAGQLILFNSIISKALSVREAEAMAAKLQTQTKEIEQKQQEKKSIKIPELEEIKEKFINVLGTKISIKGSLNKGKIEIAYYSADDLDRIYEIISKDTSD